MEEKPPAANDVDELRRRAEMHRPVAEALIGLQEAEAREQAEARGLTVRILRPGVQAMTLSFGPNRVNLVVSGGCVVNAFMG